MHWSTAYLGKKWVSGARGPNEFDCWGLVRWIYKKQLGIELPEFPGVEAKDTEAVAAMIHEHTCVGPFAQEWHRLSKPVDMCAVAMGQNDLTHCGIYLVTDGGLVLHTAEQHNVVAQPIKLLRMLGYSQIEFYQHGAHCRNFKSV